MLPAHLAAGVAAGLEAEHQALVDVQRGGGLP